MVTKKTAKKKTATKTTRTGSESAGRKMNDPLRELLEFVVTQIERADLGTQELEGIQNLTEPLQLAIEDLEDNPGPTQGGGH